MLVGREQLGLRCDHHARQLPDRRGHPVAVVGVQRDQVQRLGRRAGLFGQQLRIIERVVEGVQRAHHRVCRAEELAAGLAGVQRVVIQIARHQHIGAADFVHRGAPRRVGS